MLKIFRLIAIASALLVSALLLLCLYCPLSDGLTMLVFKAAWYSGIVTLGALMGVSVYTLGLVSTQPNGALA